MDSATARPSSFKSLLLILLGVVLGAGLVLLGFWYHSLHGGMAGRMAGVWTGTADIAGTQVALSLTLEKTGETLSGQLVATPGGQGNFQQATVDADGNIRFSMTVSGETVSFTGKAAPDIHTMTGKMVTTSYGEGTWSLAKQS